MRVYCASDVQIEKLPLGHDGIKSSALFRCQADVLHISPSLRIGYMILPKHLVSAFHHWLGFYACTVPTYIQYVMTEQLANGDFERHINRFRRAKRREINQIK